jgi:putative ABC transport system permease protein
MMRFVWSQLRHRPSRTATLALGILVAAVSFTLLTAAVKTSELQVRGTVAKNWETAYDILVRPPGSFTALERRQGLIRDNYLSGIFGGITVAQWRGILHIPGVDAAAPIANLGYIVPVTRGLNLSVNRYLTKDPVQLYRLRTTWVADRGTSTYPGQNLYVYFTRRHRFVIRYELPHEVVPGSGVLDVCSHFIAPRVRTPFPSGDVDSFLQCFSSLSPDVERHYYLPFHPGFVGSGVNLPFPMLISAIDPVQENRLLALDHTIVSGRALRISDGYRRVGLGLGYGIVVPVIAASRTYVDESLHVTVERLQPPTGSDVPAILASKQAYPFLTSLQGAPVGAHSFSPDAMYDTLLRQLAGAHSGLVATWTGGTVGYRSEGTDRLDPVPATNPVSIWKVPSFQGYFPAPPGSDDTQFRSLQVHGSPYSGTENSFFGARVQVVGRFDPTRLPGFSPLTRVPLESYYPPTAEPADAASKQALGGQPLLPSANMGGYVEQPPFMLTTLRAARAFIDPRFFHGLNEKAPISVIRVKVAGVTGPDPLSRERVRRVAQAIHDETGLAVDITAGSSPHPLVVQLAAGKFGRPPLTLREGWVKKGVAVIILSALDRKSLALFVLVLVISALFLANGALAAVRTRRSEIGTLLSMGWTQRVIFRTVLGEVLLIGLMAGLVGAGIAAALVSVLDLRIGLARTLLVAPIAVVVSLLAGLPPAWRAARSLPLDAVRSSVTTRGGGRSARHIATMAVVELFRVPGRTLLAAAGLFIGVGALALLLAVQVAFRGALIGTLLGNFVSVQVRGVDLASVALAVALAGLCVADVLFLNIRERAPEVVTLRATGWGGAHLGRLVAYEGLGIGVLGSVPGAVLGVLVAALATGGVGARVIMAGVMAAVAGVAVAVAASVVPATVVGRAPPPTVLAEE